MALNSINISDNFPSFYHNSKGTYEAIQMLLPTIGAKRLLSMNGHEVFVKHLIGEIGDMGNNASAISQLLTTILTMLFEDEDDESTRLKIGNLISDNAHEKSTQHIWISSFVEHISSELLSPSRFRRKRVADFCLPVIASLPTAKAALVFMSVILSSEKKTKTKCMSIPSRAVSNSYASLNLGSSAASTLLPSDVYMWSILEVSENGTCNFLIM